ncbi:MAG: hypothetical protein H7336_02260 [Bacteriovorax sp.]|nr:hypothetical protein [Bacteriovorax sp.]
MKDKNFLRIKFRLCNVSLEMERNEKVEIIGHYGATLSIIEVGLGSLLHALHFPMSGIFLSLNQGYLLCRAAIAGRDLPKSEWTTYSVSNIAAVLKSLSPAGKKLGPMVSLSMQGFLFNLGTIALGTNPVGLCLGMVLSSLWTFVQPLLTYYLFFGEKLFSAAEYLYQKTLPYHKMKAESLAWIFVTLVVTKMLVACALAIIAWRRKNKSLYVKNYEEELTKRAFEKMNKGHSQNKKTHPAFLAVKDLFRPFFLLSLGMTGLFLYYSESDRSQIGWYLMRPIAIGFIFFYISRTMTLDRLLVKMQSGKFRSFSLGCQTALAKIRTFV